MREAMYVVGFNLAVGCAFARVAGIVIGAARSALKRGSFERVRFGVVEAMTLLEPPALALCAYLLLAGRESSAAADIGDAVAALAGGSLALGGLALCVWTLFSWREMFVGHAVLQGQELVTGGAYAHVRHPVYLGGLVIWCGLGIAFLSVAAAAVTVVYVIPSYLLYMRSEEAMMLESFGGSYRRYQASVPMLLPWTRPSREQ
jgi:protein-S-isoprenylcysteine O-methyltransferase Ste14